MQSSISPTDKKTVSIGIFSYGLPRTDKKRGGFERVTHDQAQGLARLGYKVTVWTYDPKPQNALYEVRPLPWKKFYRGAMGPRFLMGYLGNVLALLPSYKGMDLLIAHGDSLLMPILGKPLIRVMHGSALEEAKKATGWIRWAHQMGVYLLEQLTSRLQSGSVAVSQNTLESLPAIKKVIPNGVDLDSFHWNPADKTTKPSLLFVGALGGRKRGGLALDWFREKIQPAVPDAELHMVSDTGPRVSGVHYHYGIDDIALAKLYRNSWVYISPSSYEGFGLPYLEAMASGTPVIATPNPGSREVLGNGQYGLLPDDVNFCSEVIQLLTQSDLRNHWTRIGLKRCKEYSLELMAQRYSELIESMLIC